MATETVVSVLLSDPPPVLVAPALLRGLGLVERPVDPDFADTLAAGYIESDIAFATRIGGRP
ncbi:hypothetical protein [Streptomyces sp. ISL-94]|uniref:hypothetical protein n=1 Tax=Streptomyces sp. ISL-94 TaxID=2819190 RepID=UPI001BE7043E|nr:hypothetical protein [Streptomyces sp. ISL-94]MBT2477586.1 hypothetical protein [Streptomyces sp. ISL-94]